MRTLDEAAPFSKPAPPTVVIPERRPGAAKDAVSGIHAAASIPMIRPTTRRVAPVVAVVPVASTISTAPALSRAVPPSVVAARRHLRPHCVGWRIARRQR